MNRLIFASTRRTLNRSEKESVNRAVKETMKTGVKTEASDSRLGAVASTATTLCTAKELHLQMPLSSVYVMEEISPPLSDSNLETLASQPFGTNEGLKPVRSFQDRPGVEGGRRRRKAFAARANQHRPCSFTDLPSKALALGLSLVRHPWLPPPSSVTELIYSPYRAA
ncbi:hypothetical protein U1Q18_045891 [Sarracenia purpurea var. burkii]